MRLVAPIAAAAVLASLASGCQDSGPPVVTRTVQFRAIAEDGRELNDVAIALNGRELGVTDSSGRLEVELTGRQGSVFRPRANCPRPMVSPDALPSITLRGFADGRAPLAIEVRCGRRTRLVGVVVRARAVDRHRMPEEDPRYGSGRAREKAQERLRRALIDEATARPLANVPVLLKGKPIGRTDEYGNAHVALHVPPNNRFQLELDAASAGYAALLPRRPVAHFAIESRDDLFLFDQLFVNEVEPPPPPKKARPRRKQRSKAAPQRRRIKIIRQGQDRAMVEMNK